MDNLTNDLTWPVIYREVLEIGNKESNVAICSLWTHRKSAARKFAGSEYAIIGNLYSAGGVSPLIRNILANPNIRYLIVWGNDLSNSAHSLIEFFQEGVDEHHKTLSSAVQIEQEIDASAIKSVREYVKLYDLRGKDTEFVKAFISRLDQLPPFANPQYFPYPEKIESKATGLDYPSEPSGFSITRQLVCEAYLELIYTTMRFGIVKSSRTETYREILNVVAVVLNENPANPSLPSYLPVSQTQLNEYYKQVTTPIKFEGTTYTYGERLMNFRGIDQIMIMVEKLKRLPNNKRMIATTWDVEKDSTGRALGLVERSDAARVAADGLGGAGGGVPPAGVT
ncbi:MAG: hypothetical protein L0287_10750, partial [Anaerolineae bacterium]|nr:hypothetical protein [Anaerolineae bacterium]